MTFFGGSQFTDSGWEGTKKGVSGLSTPKTSECGINLKINTIGYYFKIIIFSPLPH